MRIHRNILLSAVVALAVAAPAAAGPGNDPQGARSAPDGHYEIEDACDGDATLTTNLDPILWPPNHKYVPAEFTMTDDSGDDVTLTTRVTHDEYVTEFMPESEDDQPGDEFPGSGNTQNDASPFFMMDTEEASNTNTHQIRAERSGRGDGRDYTIDIVGSSANSGCTATLTSHVPHDMRSDKAPPKDDKNPDQQPADS